MSNKDKKPQLSEKGAAKYFKTSAATMPSDQIYRELVMNSIEACKKAKAIDPNFKGKIRLGEDSSLPGKLTVADNAIGMKSNRIADLVINLAETEQESEEGNFGAGTKVAGFANNEYGIIYTSKHVSEDIGSRCRVYFNEEDCYAIKYYPEYNSCTVPIDPEDLSKLFKEYNQGTTVTLCGMTENENTLEPPRQFFSSSLLKDGRKGVLWRSALLNTKFFNLPDFIEIRNEVIREDRKNFELIKGHKHFMNMFAMSKGVFENSLAKFHWWILNPEKRAERRGRGEAICNGHLAYLHKNEIIDIGYDKKGSKNPLKNWGLTYSARDVVLIIEPKNFVINTQRTTMHKNNIEYTQYKSNFKEYFMENMPEKIKKYESSLQDKYSKALFDDNNLIKEARKYLKDIYAGHPLGEEMSDNSSMYGGMKLNVNSKSKWSKKTVIPGPNTGTDPVFAGIKNKLGDIKSKPASANPLPKFIERSDMEKDEWVEYNWDNNEVYLNEKCPIINECAKRAEEKNGIKSETYVTLTKLVISQDLQFSIAMLRFKNTHLSEEKKREILEGDSLMLTLLNTKQIVDRVQLLTKNIVSQERAISKKPEVGKSSNLFNGLNS